MRNYLPTRTILHTGTRISYYINFIKLDFIINDVFLLPLLVATCKEIQWFDESNNVF